MPRLAAALVLAALLAGCGGSSRPGFAHASGWHVLTEPGQIISAADVPFAVADRSQSAPIHTVESLPARGVVIWVQWTRRGEFPAKDRRYYPKRPLPLRVQNMAAVQPEGFTCPRTSGSGCTTRALQAGSGRWDVAVWVFFGTAHPSRPTVAAADSELTRLRFG